MIDQAKMQAEWDAAEAEKDKMDAAAKALWDIVPLGTSYEDVQGMVDAIRNGIIRAPRDVEAEEFLAGVLAHRIVEG